MEKHSMELVIKKLEGLFDEFNKELFNNELQKAVIIVAPDTTRGAYGWCSVNKIWKTDKEEISYNEINIVAEYLNRPMVEVAGTLLHEMVHLYNLQIGVKDTSRSNQYHNKKFKVEAEKRGLLVEADKKYGWAFTKLNPEAEAFVESLELEDFPLNRFKDIKLKSKGKSSSKKYVCPNCGLIVRATKEVNVECGDCNVKMEVEG